MLVNKLNYLGSAYPDINMMGKLSYVGLVTWRQDTLHVQGVTDITVMGLVKPWTYKAWHNSHALSPWRTLIACLQSFHLSKQPFLRHPFTFLLTCFAFLLQLINQDQKIPNLSCKNNFFSSFSEDFFLSFGMFTKTVDLF